MIRPLILLSWTAKKAQDLAPHVYLIIPFTICICLKGYVRLGWCSGNNDFGLSDSFPRTNRCFGGETRKARMRAPPQMIPPSNPSLLPSQSTIFQEGLKSEVGVYGFFFPAQFVPRKKREFIVTRKIYLWNQYCF